MITPDLGVLEGIIRMSMIELCAERGISCVKRPLPATELREANEIFRSTTVRGVLLETQIDGYILSNEQPAPVGSDLRGQYPAKQAQGCHATPIYDDPEASEQR